jgi:hypothetical protein
VLMDATGGRYNASADLSKLEYEWPALGYTEGFGAATKRLLFQTFIYTSMGLLFAWRAKVRFRRKIF